MSWMHAVVKLERRIAERIEGAFGRGSARTVLELRHQILDEIDRRIEGFAGKLLPFDRLVVRLHPGDPARDAMLRSALLDDHTLAGDVRKLLAESRARLPESLDVAAGFVEAGSALDGSGRAFSIELMRTEGAKARAERGEPVPAAELVVLKGASDPPVYRVTRRRVCIGRLRELVDRDGRMVRRNDLVFLDNGDEINSTVGRAHATVYLDGGDYHVADEASRYGTRIFREGRSIEVPSGNRRGIRLLSGDEICLGRACVRFDLS